MDLKSFTPKNLHRRSTMLFDRLRGLDFLTVILGSGVKPSRISTKCLKNLGPCGSPLQQLLK